MSQTQIKHAFGATQGQVRTGRVAKPDTTGILRQRITIRHLGDHGAAVLKPILSSLSSRSFTLPSQDSLCKTQTYHKRSCFRVKKNLYWPRAYSHCAGEARTA